MVRSLAHPPEDGVPDSGRERQGADRGSGPATLGWHYGANASTGKKTGKKDGHGPRCDMETEPDREQEAVPGTARCVQHPRFGLGVQLEQGISAQEAA